MSHAFRPNGVSQRLSDMFLANDIVKGLRAEPAGENGIVSAIAHGLRFLEKLRHFLRHLVCVHRRTAERTSAFDCMCSIAVHCDEFTIDRECNTVRSGAFSETRLP